MKIGNLVSETLKQQAFRAAHIKKLQDAFDNLDAAGLLRLSRDPLLSIVVLN